MIPAEAARDTAKLLADTAENMPVRQLTYELRRRARTPPSPGWR